MEGYESLYRGMLASLRDHSDIEVHEASDQCLPVNAQTRQIFAKLLRKQRGMMLPEPLVPYVDVSSWVRARWTTRVAERASVGGEMRLRPLFEVFLSDAPALGHPVLGEARLSRLRRFRTIDDLASSGAGQQAGLLLPTEGALSAAGPIHFYDRGELFEMTVGYGEYVEHMLRLKGIGGWQYLLCKLEDAPARDELRAECIRKIASLARLFPHEDFAPYERMARAM